MSPVSIKLNRRVVKAFNSYEDAVYNDGATMCMKREDILKDTKTEDRALPNRKIPKNWEIITPLTLLVEKMPGIVLTVHNLQLFVLMIMFDSADISDVAEIVLTRKIEDTGKGIKYEFDIFNQYMRHSVKWWKTPMHTSCHPLITME